MTSFKDISTEELRDHWISAVNKIDELQDRREAIPGDLANQEYLLGREIGRREAEESRQEGGYSVVFLIDGDEAEYALQAGNLSDAHLEAKRGAQSMQVITGSTVTVERIRSGND